MGAIKMFFFPCFLMVLIIILLCYNIELYPSSGDIKLIEQSFDSSTKTTSSSSSETELLRNRKLLSSGEDCSSRDISISQSKDSSSGIPQYIVQIVNTCMSNCVPTNIHVHCGWFASARFVNPKIFKRLSHDDCLVNDGQPLKNSQIIHFTYSNSFMYPLSFRSGSFCGNLEIQE